MVNWLKILRRVFCRNDFSRVVLGLVCLLRSIVGWLKSPVSIVSSLFFIVERLGSNPKSTGVTSSENELVSLIV